MKVKKLLSLLCALALSISLTGQVYATNMEEQYYEIEDQDTRVQGSNSIIPDSYRSDEEPWAKNIVVKNQGSPGLCWAFSTTTAAEYSYAKEMYEKTGQVYNVDETSPGHFGYFHYNRENDPLRNTGGDYNNVPYGEDWASSGGNSIYVMQSLANWTGLATEDEAPYLNVLNSVNYRGEWDGETIPYDSDIAYKDDIIIQNSTYYSDLDTNEVKKLIMKYGAIVSAMYMEDNGAYFSRDRKSYYVYNGGYLNHAITVIGWDDNYPKENFTHGIAGFSTAYSNDVTTPPGDGAWIIQNSWGYDHGGTGKFYISYYSKQSPLYGYFAYDMQSADTYQYNFQYDGSADCGDSSDYGNDNFYTGKNTKAANIYTNNTGRTLSLDAVGFTTYNENKVNYNIKVYTDLSNSRNPESGTLQSTTAFTTETAGVKTAPLSQTVSIAPGQSFSVVFTFSQDTYFGVEKPRYRNGFTFDVEINQGQSYFCSTAGTWTDMYNNDACFRIKAFANEASLFDPPELSTAQKPKAKTDLVYTGLEQELLTAPTGYLHSGYSMYYALVNSGEPTAKDWSKEIPKAVNAGTYNVYYLLKGDSVHLDSKPIKIPVTIAKASIPSNAPDSKIIANDKNIKVSDVDLPIGWTWRSSDLNKSLVTGGNITAVAQYTAADKDNYSTTSRTIVITKNKASNDNPTPNPTPSTTTSQVVKIIVDELNVRKGPGVQYDIVTALKEGGAYTIVEKQNGWGKLKSGIGWINCSDSYVKVIR